MKKTIAIFSLLGIFILAYPSKIKNINIKCIDKNGYTRSTLYSSQISNLLIEFDYYNDKSFVNDDDIKVIISGSGVKNNWFFEVPNIKPGDNHYSVKIQSFSSNIASYFPAGEYFLLIESSMAFSKFQTFTISAVSAEEMMLAINTAESQHYANTNQNSNTTSSNSSKTSVSAGAVLAVAGLGLLAACLLSRDDNTNSSSNSTPNHSSYSSSSNYSGSSSSQNSSNSSYNSSPKITRDNILDYVNSFELDKSKSNEYMLVYEVEFKIGNSYRKGVFPIYYQIKDYDCFGCSSHSKGEWGILTGFGSTQQRVNPSTKQEALYKSCPPYLKQ